VSIEFGTVNVILNETFDNPKVDQFDTAVADQVAGASGQGSIAEISDSLDRNSSTKAVSFTQVINGSVQEGIGALTQKIADNPSPDLELTIRVQTAHDAMKSFGKIADASNNGQSKHTEKMAQKQKEQGSSN